MSYLFDQSDTSKAIEALRTEIALWMANQPIEIRNDLITQLDGVIPDPFGMDDSDQLDLLTRWFESKRG